MNEAELLFSEILNCDRASLYLNKAAVLSRDAAVLISRILKRRINGEPIQYVLGKTEFMGLEFKVNKNVFIPRPETEILVETAIEKAQERRSAGAQELRILEIGTGSGCIAVSLAKLLPDAPITATDISEKALELARENAVLNGVAETTRFVKSDLFTQYSILNTQYDIIVSNPPYVATEEIEDLQPEIQYEPRIALDGGRDGLNFYRRLITETAHYLKRNGLLILEIGHNQKDAIEDILRNKQEFEIIEVIKDYNNIDRVIIARKIKHETCGM